MAINPALPLLTVPPAIVLAKRVRFLALSADGAHAIVEVEVANGVWKAASVDKVTGAGTVIDDDGQPLAITVRNGMNATCRFSWSGGQMKGGTENNSDIIATVTVSVVPD